MTLFVLTIGVILDTKKSYFCIVLKWLIYSLFFVYSLYNLGIFTYLQDFSLKNVSQFVFGFVAPLALVVCIKIISNYKIKGHKIFNYLTLWIIYVVIALIWYQIFPEEVNLILLLFFWIISFAIIVVYKYHVYKSKNKG